MLKPSQLDLFELSAVDRLAETNNTTGAIRNPALRDDELFLPDLPADLIRKYYTDAPGNEIGSGKFSHPESSAALVANAFGLFLEQPGDMPPIPGCEQWWSPASSISLETTLQFPWRKGRHPCLDVLAVTEFAVFAIESKRFEPYREKLPAFFSNAYCRRVWGDGMDGYEFVRDMLRGCGSLFARLDAAQLVKHALGLRTAIHRDPHMRGKVPVLVYLYAEPAQWPDGRPVSALDVRAHRTEIDRFGKCVAGSEVVFKPVSYRELMAVWAASAVQRISDHAAAIIRRFAL
jgi:hypothetical protein